MKFSALALFLLLFSALPSARAGQDLKLEDFLGRYSLVENKQGSCHQRLEVMFFQSVSERPASLFFYGSDLSDGSSTLKGIWTVFEFQDLSGSLTRVDWRTSYPFSFWPIQWTDAYGAVKGNTLTGKLVKALYMPLKYDKRATQDITATLGSDVLSYTNVNVTVDGASTNACVYRKN